VAGVAGEVADGVTGAVAGGQRKVMVLCCRTGGGGATPAAQISASGAGNRARQSPISGAADGPGPGSEVKMWRRVQGELFGDLGVQALIWVTRLAVTASSAR